jgi:hypothetical protein
MHSNMMHVCVYVCVCVCVILIVHTHTHTHTRTRPQNPRHCHQIATMQQAIQKKTVTLNETR